jgi:hypothetical protein
MICSWLIPGVLRFWWRENSVNERLNNTGRRTGLWLLDQQSDWICHCGIILPIYTGFQSGNPVRLRKVQRIAISSSWPMLNSFRKFNNPKSELVWEELPWDMRPEHDQGVMIVSSCPILRSRKSPEAESGILTEVSQTLSARLSTKRRKSNKNAIHCRELPTICGKATRVGRIIELIWIKKFFEFRDKWIIHCWEKWSILTATGKIRDSNTAPRSMKQSQISRDHRIHQSIRYRLRYVN